MIHRQLTLFNRDVAGGRAEHGGSKRADGLCRSGQHVLADTGVTTVVKLGRNTECCTPCFQAARQRSNDTKRDLRALSAGDIDTVVVDRLVSGDFWGHATRGERKLAAERLLRLGFQHKDIAERLDISLQTVGRYKKEMPK